MSDPKAWLSAREASARLDVKLSTLYAYASRGLVESVPDPRGRGRVYARESIERLKARHDARAGHAAVAAGALRWGEPTLETGVVEIRPDGPYCRGHSLIALANGEHGFESICTLLWTGKLGVADAPRETRGVARQTSAPAQPADPSPLAYLAAAVALAALRDPERHGASDVQEHARARGLIAWLAGIAGGRAKPLPSSRRATTAERLLHGFGQRATRPSVALVDRVLIMSADHDLAASTFAARVTASTDADLYACLGAALHALDGPRHGGVSARIEALLREIKTPAHAASVVRERLSRGERIPGFGHPLYPNGDPRAPAMLALASEGGRSTPRLARLSALVAAMRRAGHAPPNFDIGLVAVCSALGLPEGAPASIFAVGRCAGWVAHILEQRQQGYLLRPRTRFVPSSAP
jgi:citrate synthase